MDLRLHGRNAYITGGAQGIGAAIASRLSAEGARVAVADIDHERLVAHRDGWAVGESEPVLIAADLSTTEGVRRAGDEVLAAFGGPPDVLVNNVGVAVSRAFVDIDDDAWQETFQLNFMSYVRTSRHLVPLMTRRPDASVVNIASDLAKQPESVPADYGAMKSAILYLTKALSLEYAPAVRVNAVLPGPVWTGLWSRPGGVVDRLAEMYDTDRDTALDRYLRDRQLTMGIADPEDVASLVAYLVSPLAKRVTGSAFDVGGTIRGTNLGGPVMRIHNDDGRLKLAAGGGAVDVHRVSDGRFGPAPETVFDRWADFTAWVAASTFQPHLVEPVGDARRFGPPSPRPRQIFAVALNYAAHATESGFARPDHPLIFTKFASSLTGPATRVALPAGGNVDWEVELVVVLGRGGRDIPAELAYAHVAGLTVGQDISERRNQHAGPSPQFSLAKSFAGFSPTGPTLVTLDEIADVGKLGLVAEINGEIVQSGNTAQLIFPIPKLIEYLSSVVELYPGDLIFTGTPDGVGAGRTPQRFLRPGEVLTSRIEGIGELTQTFVAHDTVSDLAGAEASRS